MCIPGKKKSSKCIHFEDYGYTETHTSFGPASEHSRHAPGLGPTFSLFLTTSYAEYLRFHSSKSPAADSEVRTLSYEQNYELTLTSNMGIMIFTIIFVK